MEHLLNAVEDGLKHGNWYAALMVALTLPDICAKVDGRKGGSSSRYISWARQWLEPMYVNNKTDPPTFRLKAGDLYALRCAYCHEASHNLENHKSKEVLESFNITAPNSDGNVVHLNRVDGALQLQVDYFCSDICASVRLWLADRGNDPEVQSNLTRLALIKGQMWL